MADELDFGFPATSTRTSSEDFTTTTLIVFVDASLDYIDSTLGGDAESAHAAAGIPRSDGSDGGAASRGASLRRAIFTSQAGHGVSATDSQAFATAPAGAQQSGTRATELRGAGLFVGGGCGESSGGIAQENPDLAGNRQDSGGLLGATAAEEAETEEEITSGANRLYHQDATSSIRKNDMDDSLGYGGGNNDKGDQ